MRDWQYTKFPSRAPLIRSRRSTSLDPSPPPPRPADRKLKSREKRL